jgi:cytochrome c-type biogenesis protein CcmF
MIGELGHFSLILALILSIVQFIVPFYGARLHNNNIMAVAITASIFVFMTISIAFCALVHAYVTSDFSVINVVENSHSLKPLIYKISGVWGNHEGSMLLWVLILALFGALVACFGKNMPHRLKAHVLMVQGSITSAFLMFILLSSNPFLRMANPPFEGKDLNPVLQDIGLAIHPPLLYLGYVGFSISFSFAIAALIEGKLDAAWARWVRPWVLTAWMFLTAGIAMGSYWAYYELGWGGWWFWDPVENASFMPWLSGTALLHCAVVMEKRGALKIWTILLAIVTFSFALLGTFLVRSGVLTSVHSFANDPKRGLFILAILCVFIGGALLLFAFRAQSIERGGLFHPISREGALVLNNLFLCTASASILIGTLYPLVLETVTGEKISVGAPYFNLTFGPLMVPLLFAMPFGPLMAWKRGDLLGVAQRLWTAFAIALIIALGFIYINRSAPVLSVIGIGLAAFVILGSIVDLAEKAGIGKVSLVASFHRLKGLSRAMWGTFFGHLGIGVTTLGIVVVSVFGLETVAEMRRGESQEIGGYSVVFESLTPVQGVNYTEEQGVFTINNLHGDLISRVISSKRFYPVRETPTTEAGIVTRRLSQIYISIGDQRENGTLIVRLWYKPLITLIWGGALIMVFGALMSLSDRRLRVGAPKRKRVALR